MEINNIETMLLARVLRAVLISMDDLEEEGWVFWECVETPKIVLKDEDRNILKRKLLPRLEAIEREM